MAFFGINLVHLGGQVILGSTAPGAARGHGTGGGPMHTSSWIWPKRENVMRRGGDFGQMAQMFGV